jgi:hypothetical protein
MRHEEIGPLVERLAASIEGHIPRRNDPEIYALLQALRAAFANGNEKDTLQAASQIEQHALFRYAAVAELAGELSRKLEG